MKIRFIAIVSILVILLTTSVYGNVVQYLQAEVVDYKITIDNEEKKLENDIVTINDRTYVPLRELSEVLNCAVDWDENIESVNISSSGVKKENMKKQILEKISPFLKFNLDERINILDFSYSSDKSDSHIYEPGDLNTTEVKMLIEGDTDYINSFVFTKANSSISNFNENSILYKELNALVDRYCFNREKIKLRISFGDYSKNFKDGLYHTQHEVYLLTDGIEKDGKLKIAIYFNYPTEIDIDDNGNVTDKWDVVAH